MTMTFPLASWIPHSRLRLIQGTILHIKVSSMN
jgi:hypothetical protein